MLLELEARQRAQAAGVPLAASLLRAGSSSAHHESVDDAIRSESAELYTSVCMPEGKDAVGAAAAAAAGGERALACTAGRQLLTTDLQAFMDLRRAAGAELDPRQHSLADGHDGRFVDPKDWPETRAPKKGRELQAAVAAGHVRAHEEMLLRHHIGGAEIHDGFR